MTHRETSLTSNPSLTRKEGNTHYAYIYIYIYREREGEKKRQGD